MFIIQKKFYQLIGNKLISIGLKAQNIIAQPRGLGIFNLYKSKSSERARYQKSLESLPLQSPKPIHRQLFLRNHLSTPYLLEKLKTRTWIHIHKKNLV